MQNSPARPATEICPFGPEGLDRARVLIKADDPVAVPTETVYGLAANARSSDAVAAIYAAKGRPSFNPLIVHVQDMEMAHSIARFNEAAEELAARFWPGPLTLVLPVREEAGISPLVTAGLSTIAIRMPAHRAMRSLIAHCGLPLAAPSANRSGAISPTQASHVMQSLDGRIPLILDDGPAEQGLESTIVAPGSEVIRLLRPGPVTAQQIETLLSMPVMAAGGSAIEAPGQMESHYAPSKPLRLNARSAEPDEFLIGFGFMPCDLNLSEDGSLEEAAAALFAALHIADASSRARIAVAPLPSTGIGEAINDRLRRAAA